MPRISHPLQPIISSFFYGFVGGLVVLGSLLYILTLEHTVGYLLSDVLPIGLIGVSEILLYLCTFGLVILLFGNKILRVLEPFPNPFTYRMLFTRHLRESLLFYLYIVFLIPTILDLSRNDFYGGIGDALTLFLYIVALLSIFTNLLSLIVAQHQNQTPS